MSSDVGSIQLRELSVRITKGTTPTKGEGFVASGINYIKSESITADGSIDASKFAFIDANTHEKLARSQLRAGNVLFSMAGVYLGKTAVVLPEHLPANTNQAVGIVTLDESKADPYFIHYSLQSPACRAWVLRSAAQSAQPNFNLQEIGDLKIPAFPLARQKEIASVLRMLDDRIALLRETNATLEAIAQALFKSWFVDFDPVHARAKAALSPCSPPTGERDLPPLPAGEGWGEGEGLPEPLAALFPDSFEESPLGLVPRGWRVGPVGDLGDVICGKTPPTSDAENYGDDVPFITIPDMHGLLAVTSTARALSRKGADCQPKKYLPAGAVCVSCIATPGLVVQVTEASQTNQQINSVVPYPKWGRSFPLFLLRRIGDKVRSGGAGGSVFHNLSKSGFEQIQELLPYEGVAQAYGQIVDPLVEKIIANQRQAQTLATLRDTLLPRLISGQLRLPEAEALAEEVQA